MTLIISLLVAYGMFHGVREVGNAWVDADFSERTNEWIVFSLIIFFMVGIIFEIRYLGR